MKRIADVCFFERFKLSLDIAGSDGGIAFPADRIERAISVTAMREQFDSVIHVNFSISELSALQVFFVDASLPDRPTSNRTAIASCFTLLFMKPINPQAPPAADKVVVAADIVNGAIVVAFDDGKEAVFTAADLYSLAPEEWQLAKQVKKLLE